MKLEHEEAEDQRLEVLMVVAFSMLGLLGSPALLSYSRGGGGLFGRAKILSATNRFVFHHLSTGNQVV